jgi:prevent-host-death family protein
MITVKENTTLVGVSELRTSIDKVLEKAQEGLVIIEKRRKPQAVLISNKEYEYIQEVMEMAEDFVLGYIAKERFENTNNSDFIDLESLIK